MQFKKVRGKIQVIKYMGYNNEKKRAITKMVGSLDSYSMHPSVGLLESLTVDEKEELQSYINNVRQSREKENDSHTIYMAVSYIKRITDTLTKDDADSSSINTADMWEAIDALQKALKKSGHPKPKKIKTVTKKDPRQTDLPIEGS